MNLPPLPLTVQRAHRYGLTAQDMQEVIEYLDTYDELGVMQDSDNNSRWAYACRGLLCAAIVAYCRPFIKNESLGFATQRLGSKSFNAVRERRAVHQLVIEKRNTFIAHADWKARHAKILRVQANSVTWSMPTPNVWEGLDVKEFRRLVEGVYRECLDKGFEAAKQAGPVSSL